MINARPTEWRNTFGHMPATDLVSRHCNPPACQLRNKASRHCETKHLKEQYNLSWQMQRRGRLKALRLSVQTIDGLSFTNELVHIWTFNLKPGSKSSFVPCDCLRFGCFGRDPKGVFPTHRSTVNMPDKQAQRFDHLCIPWLISMKSCSHANMMAAHRVANICKKRPTESGTLGRIT